MSLCSFFFTVSSWLSPTSCVLSAASTVQCLSRVLSLSLLVLPLIAILAISSAAPAMWRQVFQKLEKKLPGPLWLSAGQSYVICSGRDIAWARQEPRPQLHQHTSSHTHPVSHTRTHTESSEIFPRMAQRLWVPIVLLINFDPLLCKWLWGKC